MTASRAYMQISPYIYKTTTKTPAADTSEHLNLHKLQMQYSWDRGSHWLAQKLIKTGSQNSVKDSKVHQSILSIWIDREWNVMPFIIAWVVLQISNASRSSARQVLISNSLSLSLLAVSILYMYNWLSIGKTDTLNTSLSINVDDN
jgi:hypothetical protein